MTCDDFGRDQIFTQISASFFSFGHPTQVPSQVQPAATCDYWRVCLTRALVPVQFRATSKKGKHVMYHKKYVFFNFTRDSFKKTGYKCCANGAAHLFFYFAGFSKPRSHRPSDKSNQPCFPYIWVTAILPQFFKLSTLSFPLSSRLFETPGIWNQSSEDHFSLLVLFLQFSPQISKATMLG